MTRTRQASGRRRFVPIATAWAFSLVVVIATATNCSIDHRSQEFACTTTADCTGGRTCSADGFCVTSGGGTDGGNPGSGSNHIDAGIDARAQDAGHPADAAMCPSICSSCDFQSHTCDIDCAVGSNRCGGGTTTGSGSQPMTVQCPPGFNCTIECTPQGSCRSISCAGALSCEIQCNAANSCRTVACGAGACDVTCSGQSSCKNVACGESCRCDVNCVGVETCSGSVICSNDTCGDILDNGCTSTNDPSCDTCQ